jgi:hypothetical protein
MAGIHNSVNNAMSQYHLRNGAERGNGMLDRMRNRLSDAVSSVPGQLCLPFREMKYSICDTVSRIITQIKTRIQVRMDNSRQ